MAGVIKKYGNLFIWDVTLTVATAATSATATSDSAFYGKIAKIEIDPGAAMATSATLKGYEANTPLATGTRDHFLNYTFPESQVELVMYPRVAAVINTGTAAYYNDESDEEVMTQYVVCDALTVDLASAVAADSVRVRIYVEK